MARPPGHSAQASAVAWSKPVHTDSNSPAGGGRSIHSGSRDLSSSAKLARKRMPPVRVSIRAGCVSSPAGSQPQLPKEEKPESNLRARATEFKDVAAGHQVQMRAAVLKQGDLRRLTGGRKDPNIIVIRDSIGRSHPTWRMENFDQHSFDCTSTARSVDGSCSKRNTTVPCVTGSRAGVVATRATSSERDRLDQVKVAGPRVAATPPVRIHPGLDRHHGGRHGMMSAWRTAGLKVARGDHSDPLTDYAEPSLAAFGQSVPPNGTTSSHRERPR